MFKGMHDALWGLKKVFGSPALLRLALAPVLIAAVPIGLAFVGYRGLYAAFSDETVTVPFIGSALELGQLLTDAFWVLAYVLFVVILAVFTTPFCEMISERIECEISGHQPPRVSLLRLCFEIFRGILHASRRGIIYLLSLAALLPVMLLPDPVDNVLYALGTAYLTVRFTAYDAFDTVWARKNWAYRRKVDYLATHRARAYGLGAVVAGLVLVPVLNIFAFPAGSAGAARQYCQDSGDC